MRYILDSAQMKQCDTNTMEHYGMVSAVLMERAAMSVADAFYQRFPDRHTSVLIACGAGNNGGDGIAVGRLLMLKGYPVTLLILGKEEKMTVETARQFQIATKYQIPMIFEMDSVAEHYDVVMDAIFGIGLCREIAGKYRDVILQLNQMETYRIAIDISSGVSANDGSILGVAFQADLTVTMGFEKIGQLLYPGADMTGELICADIGIDDNSLLDIQANVRKSEWVDLSRLPKRTDRSNKGTYGKVLIFAGSHNMAGAAIFAAKAAYRMGAGLVKLATVESNREIIQVSVPEAILVTFDEDTDIKTFVSEQIEWADAIVVGPGLGTGKTAEAMVDVILNRNTKPCVVDADGLNIVSKHLEWLEAVPFDQIIFTPHLGEMSRLNGRSISDIQFHMLECAKDFAKKYGITTILKDARTITALPTGRCYINTSGNHGMATGGSGDVLTGILGTLLAQKMMVEDAASLGVFLHGVAGDAAAEQMGKAGMMASDIIIGISKVISEVLETEA